MTRALPVRVAGCEIVTAAGQGELTARGLPGGVAPLAVRGCDDRGVLRPLAQDDGDA